MSDWEPIFTEKGLVQGVQKTTPTTAPDHLPDLVAALLAWRDGDLVNPSPRERYSQRLAGYAAARIKELENIGIPEDVEMPNNLSPGARAIFRAMQALNKHKDIDRMMRDLEDGKMNDG